MKVVVVVISCLFSFMVNTLLAKDMYQWRDAQGIIHYTDNPALKHKKNVKTIHLTSLDHVNFYTAKKPEIDLGYQQQLKAHEAKEQAVQTAQLERQKLQCKKKHDYLHLLKTDPPRLAKKNPDGSNHFISSDELTQYIANEEVKYNRNCAYL